MEIRWRNALRHRASHFIGRIKQIFVDSRPRTWARAALLPMFHHLESSPDLIALLLRGHATGSSMDAQAVFRKQDRRLLFAVSPEDRPENWLPSPEGLGWLGIRQAPRDITVVCVSRLGSHFFCKVLEMENGCMRQVSDHRQLPEVFRVSPLDRWYAGCQAGSPTPDLRQRYIQWEQEKIAREVEARKQEQAKQESIARATLERQEREERARRARMFRSLKVAEPRRPLNQDSDDIYSRYLRAELEEARMSMTRLKPGGRPLGVFNDYMKEHGVRYDYAVPATVEQAVLAGVADWIEQQGNANYPESG
jgi:hypothetical protein